MREHEHFHPLGKQPSEVTRALQGGLRESLPLGDVRDFDEARRGFLAAPAYREIKAEAGHIAWSIGAYDFLREGHE